MRFLVSLFLSLILFEPLFGLPLFKTTIENQPDTLEVIVLKVAFQESDSKYITGNGSFNSDIVFEGYNLEKPGTRDTETYWLQQFSTTNKWLHSVSNNQLTIKADIYPKDSSAYVLPRQMIGYGRTQKTDDEKSAQFDSTRALLYMEFIADAVQSVAQSTENPFLKAPPLSNVHRVYLLLHAGSSRYSDGGSLGLSNADSPGDFIDFFIAREDFAYLKDSKDHGNSTNGITVASPSIDTITSIMVVSEHASQDSLNWGIQGILTNQLLRSMGLPNTYDIVAGESRLGFFDVMDFAGHNAINGFFPTLPSAWLRSFMDWTPTLTPKKTGSSDTIWVAAHNQSNLCPTSNCGEIIKIPINSGEYLLIENRQRSWTYDNQLVIQTIVNGLPTPYSLPFDSLASHLNTVFKGTIDSTNSLDMGLPGSGIVIWHINEWLIEETLALGYVNATNGDTLADHYPGIQLLESDGNATTGRAVSGSGFGSPSDLYPHINAKGDTITTLSNSGFTSTQSINGGHSNITLTINVPSTHVQEKNLIPRSPTETDTIINFESPIISLTIEWNPHKAVDSQWPRNTRGNAFPAAITFLNHPYNDSLALVRATSNALFQLFSLPGDTITSFVTQGINPTENKIRRQIPLADSVINEIIFSFNDGSTQSTSPIKHVVSQKSTIYTQAADGQTKAFHFSSDSTLQLDSLTIPESSGLMSIDSLLFSLTLSGIVSLNQSLDTVAHYRFPVLDNAFVPQSFAQGATQSSNNLPTIVVVGSQGVVLLFNPLDKLFIQINTPLSSQPDSYSIAVSDFNRDGIDDCFILGSRGDATIIPLNSSSTEPRPLKFERSDSSSVALGDLNNDGYIDIIFTGHNALYAIDYNGAPLDGFPFYFSKTYTQNFLGYSQYLPGTIQSTPIIVDITGDSIPEILSATPEGLLYAVAHNGILLTETTTLPGTPTTLWPQTIAPVSYADSLRSPYGTLAATRSNTSGLELYIAYAHSTTELEFPLSVPSHNQWLEVGAQSQRTHYFNASLLKNPNSTIGILSIDSFYIYPSPITQNEAFVHLSLGDNATHAEVILYDVAGFVAYRTTFEQLVLGKNPRLPLNLNRLGNGIYAASITVTFVNGSQVTSWDRVGVAQ
ncbi:MAG: VCBS repeat-containing protein [Fibrobacterales bacterium]